MDFGINFVSGIDAISNRKGVVYLLLATQLFAIGPMALFVGNNALYLQLPVSKLLLLGFGITALPLAMAVMISLFFESVSSTDLDRKAVLAIVSSAAILTGLEIIGIGEMWLTPSLGFHPFIGCACAALLAIWIAKMREAKKREAVMPSAVARSELDMRQFVESRSEEFTRWLEERSLQTSG